jgi:hypothetical protein
MLHKVLGLSAATVIVAALAHGGALAATKKKTETPSPAGTTCRTVTDEAACKARSECGWVSASIDKKTNKQKRKAYCRTKPKSTKKSNTPG